MFFFEGICEEESDRASSDELSTQASNKIDSHRKIFVVSSTRCAENHPSFGKLILVLCRPKDQSLDLFSFRPKF